MTDLLTAFACNWHTTAIREGEKLHEQMDTTDSSEKPERWVSVEELKKAIEDAP
jgi:FlaA1/EpsC-like NDP-sugar epimerase